MLTKPVAIRSFLRKGVAAAALAMLAACTTPKTLTVSGGTGPSVDPNAPVKVALLVPLGSGDTGRDAVAASLVNAARLAQADLRGVALDLQVYETAGTTEGGASAASRAVTDGAKIIVGPLFSPATAAAAPVADAAGLSVLSFSNNPDVAGDNVYVLGPTFENTADRLVAFSMSRGLNNIGIVYPKGIEGEAAQAAVAAAIRNRGANLVAGLPYDLSIAGIQAAAQPMATSLLNSGANAVILTDGPTGGLGFVSESLRGLGVSAANTQFLGMQRWDVSAEVLNQPSLQGGLFAAPDPSLLTPFQGRYQNAYGERPHELAGIAYDAVAAVGALVRDAQARGSNDPFAPSRLTQPAGFAGVNGTFRLLPNGLNRRNLAIMQVQNGQAVVLDPAARTFDTVGN